MSIEFPSQAWADAYKEAINANANYKKAAKDWTHGVVAYVDLTGRKVVKVIDEVELPLPFGEIGLNLATDRLWCQR